MMINATSTVGAIGRAYENYLNTARQISSMDRVPAAQYDPAGLAISERIAAQRNAYDMKMQNTAMEINSNMTAEAALGAVQDNIHRIHELSVQASNGTYTAQDREIIQQEIDMLKTGIDDIAASTAFNGKPVLSGVSSTSLGLDGIAVVGDPSSAVKSASDAIDSVSELRASFGTQINAQRKNISNMQQQSVAAENSYNTIRGLDMARAMVELTSNKMAFETGLAVLKTEQQMGGKLLSLLSG